MFFSLPSIPSLPFTKTSQVRWQGQSPKIHVHSICHYRRLAAKSFFQWQPGSIMIHPAIPSSPHKLNGLIPWGGGILGVGLRFWWKSAIRNLNFETDQVNWSWFRTQILLLQNPSLCCSRSWFDIKNRKGMSTARAVCSKPSCLRGCLAEMEHPTIRLSILSGHAKQFSMDTAWWRFYVVCSKCRRYIGLFVVVKVHQYSYY